MPLIRTGNGALVDGKHKQFVFLSQEFLFYEGRNERKNNFENCLGIIEIIVKGSIW